MSHDSLYTWASAGPVSPGRTRAGDPTGSGGRAYPQATKLHVSPVAVSRRSQDTFADCVMSRLPQIDLESVLSPKIAVSQRIAAILRAMTSALLRRRIGIGPYSMLRLS